MLKNFFQKDYWSMTDRELANEATKYNIPHISIAGEHGEHWYMDRDKIINKLLAKDIAMRTKQIAVISIIALVISFISLSLNFLRK
ncbi:MAG TPA: hypothetical protein VEY11_06890 [Pyrinomonadaceae bacterium]|nr:hypothetical protein [Pyrinomonadaceae bacterium]